MKKFKVMLLGLRGFPEVQGGVETHCENLAPLLVEQNCDVTVLCRSPYQKKEFGNQWRGVNLISLWSPQSKKLEAIVHSVIGVCYAAIKRPDILHIHAIGPALVVPLARLFGLKVVVTHHGPDYDRQKWGALAKFALKLGEAAGMKYANQRIVISKTIQNLVKTKYDVDSVLIPNGVHLPELPNTPTHLTEFELLPRKYIILVSRLVPEKRHLDLIKAFKLAQLPDWKLAIVGGSDHPDEYSLQVLQACNDNHNIVATGFQKGAVLKDLYAFAGGFVLPSSHEGLPISLLEALSFGLPVIASDIPANLEVGLPQENYFKLGDIEHLKLRLQELAHSENKEANIQQRRAWVSEYYDWTIIAKKILQVYVDC